MVGIVGLEFLARSALPFGIATSHARADQVASESRMLLAGCVTLLVLLRASRWRPHLHGLGEFGVAVTVCLSAVYLDGICYVASGAFDALLFRAKPQFHGAELGVALWLATLAGILALSRLESRTLGLGFLLLAWWVPVLGLPGPGAGGTLVQGICCAPWSAGRILPMLVPLLWAVGYVCLERTQR